jgi:outer membrane biosynthesis protein TonB
MNSAGKHAVVALLAIFIAGCDDKKTKIAPPPQAQAPSKDAGTPGAMYPPPLMSSEPKTEQTATPPPAEAKADTPPPPPAPEPKPKKPASSRKPKPSPAKPGTTGTSEGADPTAAPTTGAPTGPPQTPAQTEAATEMAAAAGEPAAASPIGQLSTGGSAGKSQSHKATSDLIINTENGLNAIKRALNPQELETVAQIRAFLIKARQAMDNDDYDGATTLATKAKVLLDELNKD